jgi:hypothetical protein
VALSLGMDEADDRVGLRWGHVVEGAPSNVCVCVADAGKLNGVGAVAPHARATVALRAPSGQPRAKLRGQGGVIQGARGVKGGRAAPIT